LGGVTSDSLAITIATTVNVSTIDLIDASDSGSSAIDDLTNDTTPTMEFTADTGTTVEIDWDDGNGFVAAASGVTGSAQQETLGTAYTTDGIKNIQVRVTDTAGNVVTDDLAVDIDTLDPSLSAIDLIDASDEGPSNTDDITGDINPTIEFTAGAGATIEIDWGDGSGFVATAGDDTGAAQQETLAAAYIANGVKAIQVRATDAAGNADTQMLNIEIVGIGPDNFVGHGGDNQFFGYTGDD